MVTTEGKVKTADFITGKACISASSVTTTEWCIVIEETTERLSVNRFDMFERPRELLTDKRGTLEDPRRIVPKSVATAMQFELNETIGLQTPFLKLLELEPMPSQKVWPTKQEKVPGLGELTTSVDQFCRTRTLVLSRKKKFYVLWADWKRTVVKEGAWNDVVDAWIQATRIGIAHADLEQELFDTWAARECKGVPCGYQVLLALEGAAEETERRSLGRYRQSQRESSVISDCVRRIDITV